MMAGEILLGDYRVVRSLGEGTYGKVWLRERRERPEDKIAVKEAEITDITRPYLQREGQLLSDCDHRNVVRLFNVRETGNIMYIILEYCSGGNLDDYISAKDINYEQCLHYTEDMASGLDYLHSKNIMHRDVKPSNALVHGNSERDIVLKWGDFGFAKEFPAEPRNVTASGNIGTFMWMAPEVLADAGQKSRYNRPADVFSFGLMILSILNHRPGYQLYPFMGKLTFYLLQLAFFLRILYVFYIYPITALTETNTLWPETGGYLMILACKVCWFVHLNLNVSGRNTVHHLIAIGPLTFSLIQVTLR